MSVVPLGFYHTSIIGVRPGRVGGKDAEPDAPNKRDIFRVLQPPPSHDNVFSRDEPICGLGDPAGQYFRTLSRRIVIYLPDLPDLGNLIFYLPLREAAQDLRGTDPTKAKGALSYGSHPAA